MPRPLRTARHKHLAEFIASHRKDAGLLQSTVAERLDRHQPFVSAIEAGERRIDLIELLDLAEVIGFDPLELVTALLRVPKD